MRKRSFVSCAILSFFLFIFLFSYVNFIKRTKGFTLKKIISYHTYHPKWDLGSLTDEQKDLIDEIAKQPFYYLGSGKECYAFLSHDQNYVIKFFKQKHMQTQSAFNYFPFSSFPTIQAKQKEKIARHTCLRHKTYMSYVIAYQYLKDRTGVIFLHLNPTKNLKKKVTLYTEKKRKIVVDLDKMEFLIQKKGDLVFNYLTHLLQEDKIKEAKICIGSILDLLIHRSKAGIANSDNNCEKNLGFIGDRASLIDVGELRLVPSYYPSANEFYMATEDLRSWLYVHHPDLVSFLEKQIQKRIRT